MKAVTMRSKLENLEHECQVCGKTFHSEKALFGHMRSHPDRTWKGIQPPSTSSSPFSSSSSSMLYSRSLPRWSVTAQRGRKATAAAASSSSTPSKMAAANSDDKKTSYLIPPTKKLFKCNKLYKCNSCTKQFSSHQALGGHKSSHHKTLTITGTTTTTSFDSEMGRRMRILDFDLNELPPIEDDSLKIDIIQPHN